MAPKSDEFLKKLLATFKVEAGEHLQAMSSGLVALEQASTAGQQKEIIEVIFREAHSLKGAARAVNLVEMERICQPLETAFSSLKREEIVLSPVLLDVLHQATDALGRLLGSIGAERTAADKSLVEQMIQGLDAAVKRAPRLPEDEELRKPEAESPALLRPSLLAEKPILADTVRISTAKLDSLLLEAEELSSAKLMASQRAVELRQLNGVFNTWQKKWAKIHPELRAIEQSLERNSRENGQGNEHSRIRGIVEFLGWNSTFVKSLESQIATLSGRAEQDHRSLAGMVDNLLGDMKKVLMLPFSSLLEGFPKLVRDLARDRGKEVELLVQGAEIEVDRRILEEMKDPLIHMVRNCIDHGIEKPEDRKQKNKSPRGRVSLALVQVDGNKVEILISDDGTGIDIGKVRATALKLGFVSQEEANKLDDRQALPLIFHSGVSTSPVITDISGRGLGLAIVREKVEKLGGTVSVESHPGLGTKFRIVMPITLATFRGVVVRVEERLFVLSTASIERVARVSPDEIKTVENRETIQLDGQPLSLVRLGKVLELPTKTEKSDPETKLQVVVLGWGETRIACLVDEIAAEQEVLVKSLGPQLVRVRNVAGATVLGTGQVVPILSVTDLLQSAVRAASGPAVAGATVKEGEPKRKSILVAEDSITARTLLKSILESAGYDVKAAVDGVDAFTELRSGEFDLVVSDVEMPRMSGFDLTAKIRSGKKYSELPVVLVTALESREDRERGIDVGANAYIVKSSFDQSNLLEVIRRLI